MAKIIHLVSIILYSVCVTEQAYFLEKDFIDKINEKATTWKAGINFDPSTPKEHILSLLGSKGVQIPNKINYKIYKTQDDGYSSYVEIPIKFDARKQWIRCKTIGEVRDQGNCKSCWALATSSAFADRLCIATNGDFNQLLSAEEITFCCHSCGNGCNGGYPIKAWKHFKRHGLVTGGNYKSKEGCEPYRVPPCPYDEQGNNTCKGKPTEKNHRCTRMCYGDQDLDFDQDHRYTRDYYYLTYASIQKDVINYGPIEASFDVYDDFPSYKSGIYERTENATYLGGHAVKLIGWGEEYGIPYWLMVNSWNEGWGDNGLFKIRRGTNECGVDNSTTGGVPTIYVYVTEQAYFLEEDYINKINEQATTWKAGANFDPKMAEENFVKLLGSKGVQIPNKLNHKMYKTEDESYENLFGKIPRHFDARKKWRRCSTIGKVRDQGNCGSCWALATSSAFADRLCVATNGDFNQLLSAEEITFCCHSCGFGCRGGYPIKAWERFKDHGLVTGGDYKSGEGCEPYRVPPCPYDEQGNNTCAGKPTEKNHRCTRMCYGDQELDFDEDHRYTRDYYYLTYGSIQKDVMTYGPIEASFDVYSDFPSYKSGIYERTENATYLGGHAVKLIGWGEQYGIPYWLMVNSWNEGWGDNGLFKIRRGTNECGVDNSTTAGVPVTN